MTLRRKTLLIIGVLTLGLLATMFVVTRTVFMDSYLRLEQDQVTKDVGRAKSALSSDLSNLDSNLADWASWDDTYAFIEDSNPEYERSNLVDTTFVLMHLNLLVFLDRNGRVVWGRGFDLEKEQSTPMPAGLQPHFSPADLLMQHKDEESSTQGVFLLPAGPLMIASRPIVTSAGTGPIRGTAVMGRFLDAAQVSSLAQTTHLDVSLSRLEEGGLPSDFQAALPFLHRDGEVAVLPLGPRVAGYSFLTDIYGHPALLLRVAGPRAIYQQGQSTMRYALLWLFGTGVVLGLGTLALLNRVVISRLLRLSADVRGIRESDDLTRRTPVDSADELGALGGEINYLMDALKHSREELAEQYEQARELADRDPLTGLLNHRAFFMRLQKEFARAQRTGAHFAILMMDLDGFKLVNDVYGHLGGDEVLRQVADLLHERARPYDAVARYGGDEFAAILPETNRRAGLAFAVRVRSCLAARSSSGSLDGLVPIHMSIGLAVFPENGREINELVAFADAALYTAKELGGGVVGAEDGDREEAEGR